MSGSVTLNIPLKNYLTKYLNQKYGNMHCVTRSSWLGSYIIEILTKQYRKQKAAVNSQAFYTIEIPVTIMKETGFDISTEKMRRMEIMIEKVFRNDLESYIEVSIGCDLKHFNHDFQSLNKQNVTKAIEQFLSFYKISEDELSADTLYRDFFRSKESDRVKSVKKETTK